MKKISGEKCSIHRAGFYLDLLALLVRKATTILFLSSARPKYQMSHIERLLFQVIYSHPSITLPSQKLGEGQYIATYC